MEQKIHINLATKIYCKKMNCKIKKLLWAGTVGLVLLLACTVSVRAAGQTLTDAGLPDHAQSAAQAEETDRKYGTEVRAPLTVGVPTDRCPIFYIDDKTGEITGIGVDLMLAAAENSGYSVSFVAIEEETLKDALDNDKYDLIMPFGSAIASSSGKASVVTENLLQTPFTLVTIDNNKPETLNHLKVGMLRSLSGCAETVRDMYPGIEISLFKTMQEGVAALKARKVDALLHNSYVWSYILQKPSFSELSVQPSAMFSMDFRAGTADTQEGRALIERLNNGIDDISDTRRQAIILDYTSRRLYKYDFMDYMYQYGLIILMAVLLFASVIVILLQKQFVIKKEQEEKLRKLVDHDPLTGALSLKGFRKRVRELVYGNPDTPYMIVYTNFRNFKYINDSLGMEAGDRLLRFFTDKIQGSLSEEEAIGRIESDHFAILRKLEVGDGHINENRVLYNLARNYFLEHGRSNRVQICSGFYVLTPQDYMEVDVDHMLDFARVAEKRVRETRNDGYEFYNSEQWEKGKRTAAIVSRLNTSLKNGEIQVWYQPQVYYDNNEIIGAEALCRWNHKTLGWISPGEFIPVLEEAGLIYELDSFVWERVCQDLKRWKEQGKNIPVSVNLSRCDSRDNSDIPEHFNKLVKTYGISPDQLRIEITETAYVENAELLIRTTERLKELGFQVEMDDFGSGYSSLHMLKEVPVDRLKLDLYFLTETGDADKGRIIIDHVIQMGNALGMGIIAEGVENSAQAASLHKIGCSYMQGFYFYKPMPVEMFEETIEKSQSSN
jgi:EAL domain-containing protein (putative c-di-GMP-specific phosphodiesterase class I)/GGDEF domain-containing protein/ABC-type amino acid transport substrate-binding protein